MKKYYYLSFLVMFSSANCYAEELCSKYRGFMEDSFTDTKSNELQKYYAGIYLNLDGIAQIYQNMNRRLL